MVRTAQKMGLPEKSARLSSASQPDGSFTIPIRRVWMSLVLRGFLEGQAKSYGGGPKTRCRRLKQLGSSWRHIAERFNLPTSAMGRMAVAQRGLSSSPCRGGFSGGIDCAYFNCDELKLTTSVCRQRQMKEEDSTPYEIWEYLAC
jgi:hypothetical protein